MSLTTKLERRSSDRVSSFLTAVVKAKNIKGVFWKESTELISVSRTGAGFYIPHQCQAGQLVSLMIPMPRHLRCYDQDKEFYRVWGLVQHCSRLAGDDSGVERYHVGVAFIGKFAPESYANSAAQSYRITGINEDGLWRVTETKTPFVVRRFPRFHIGIDVTLQIFDTGEKVVAEEKTVTEDISLRGASLYSELDLSIGGCLRFNCEAHNFSALAVVRNQQQMDNGVRRLHLEFITDEFPIKDINLPFEETGQPAAENAVKPAQEEKEEEEDLLETAEN
jgi:hypothetical protein